MAIYKSFFEDIQRLNAIDPKFKPIEKRMLKLSEEVGELAAAILIHQDDKPSKPNSDKVETLSHILEEASDCMIQIASVFNHYNFTEEQINAELKKKLLKWENLVK